MNSGNSARTLKKWRHRCSRAGFAKTKRRRTTLEKQNMCFVDNIQRRGSLYLYVHDLVSCSNKQATEINIFLVGVSRFKFWMKLLFYCPAIQIYFTSFKIIGTYSGTARSSVVPRIFSSNHNSCCGCICGRFRFLPWHQSLFSFCQLTQ